MKEIPDHLLRAAEAKARPRVRINKYTAAIFSIVGHMKAAQTRNFSLEPAWKDLREVLDQAAAENDFTAFQDFEKAMRQLEVHSVHITVTSGSKKWDIAQGHQKGKAGSPITMALVQAIRNCQGKHRRAPTRQEILDEMNLRLVDGVDETEVSRQITRLGWKDLI